MKRQAGQAIILVLMLLGVGTLLLVPALRLTSTTLISSEVADKKTRELYAADAAQEYVMWKLLYKSYASQFSTDGQSDNFTLDICGIPVSMSVVMRAVPGQGGIILATDDVIRPTKTVSPTTAPNRSLQTFTYIIRLEQLSNNTTQKLDAVYDILPQQFGPNAYLAGSSYLRIDGGAWQSIGDPLIENYPSAQDRYRWPASGNFASPIRDFNVSQVKELKFQIRLTIPSAADDTVKYNYVVIKVGSITTFSGPQAPVAVGDGSKQDREGMLTVTKTASPSLIMPGVVQDVTYTISVSNNDNSDHNINAITDYLPPEFFYLNNSTIGFGNANPATSNQTINGVNRQVLVWVPPSNEKQISRGTTRTLTFVVRTTKDVSGSYYNEVLMESNFTMPAVYSDIGVTQSDFQSGYSWNSGTVIVPAYDSRAQAGSTTVDTNLALTGGDVAIISWQIR